MGITKLKRIEMKNIDGSNNIRYSAVLNENKLIQYTTDGVIRNHLTINDWEKRVKKIESNLLN